MVNVMSGVTMKDVQNSGPDRLAMVGVEDFSEGQALQDPAGLWRGVEFGAALGFLQYLDGLASGQTGFVVARRIDLFFVMCRGHG